MRGLLEGVVGELKGDGVVGGLMKLCLKYSLALGLCIDFNCKLEVHRVVSDCLDVCTYRLRNVYTQCMYEYNTNYTLDSILGIT